jgi:hypothetical protein
MRTIDLTKYFPKSSLGIFIVAGLFVFALTFLLMLFSSLDVLTNLIVSAVVTVFGVTVAFISSNLGQKRHKEILNSDAFLALIQTGFKVEEINRYHGLTGVYRNYIVDIHYNWSGHVNGSTEKAIVINVYFEPPLLDNSTVDHETLNKIAKKVDIAKEFFDRFSFAWRERTLIMNHFVRHRNPSLKKLTRWLDIPIDILISENLKPIDRKTNDIKTNRLPAGLYNYILHQDNQTINTGRLTIE